MKRSPVADEFDARLPADLERLLQDHLASPAELIAPSSGFAGAVMEAIGSQAGAPPPIAFPWRRVMPGVIAILCALAVFALLVARGGASGAGAGISMNLKPMGPLTSAQLALCWVAGAVLTSIATVAASLHLSGRGG